jgi:CNT family concentrative nucleoside transporter
LLGIAVLILFAWAISERRSAFPLRTVAAGLALQLVLALLLLKLPPVREALLALNHVVAALQDATLAGSRFVFGYLAGGAAPFRVANPGSSFILALQALPLVLVISALSALLYHWRSCPCWCGAARWR